MRAFYLPLKKKWFDMIRSGEKKGRIPRNKRVLVFKASQLQRTIPRLLVWSCKRISKFNRNFKQRFEKHICTKTL